MSIFIYDKCPLCSRSYFDFDHYSSFISRPYLKGPNLGYITDWEYNSYYDTIKFETGYGYSKFILTIDLKTDKIMAEQICNYYEYNYSYNGYNKFNNYNYSSYNMDQYLMFNCQNCCNFSYVLDFCVDLDHSLLKNIYLVKEFAYFPDKEIGIVNDYSFRKTSYKEYASKELTLPLVSNNLSNPYDILNKVVKLIPFM